MTVRNLDALFRPRSIAVIGASRQPSSVGGVVMRNLVRAGFEGPIMPVHPKYESVAGVLAYPDARSLPRAADLAVVCTPASTVPEIVASLAEKGTRAAIVMTAGLARERDASGKSLDRALLDAASPHMLRILGPNCLGLLAPGIALNASFAHVAASPGNLAFVSQSGAMCTAILDWAQTEGIGFSCFVSLGDALDVDFGDVIDYLASDAETRGILLYIESIRDARKFLSAARAASRNKPVVAIKAGRVAAGERAAASHTGALAGSDDVVDYALRRAGILRVGEIDELFAAVETLARAGPLPGERLLILTNGGGPGVMATDALVRGGGKLAELSDETLRRLDAVLPASWSRANPVDVIGDAPAERFAAALAIAAEDPGVDAVLVLHAPTAIAPGLAAAEAIARAAHGTRRPVLGSWLGGAAARAASAVLAQAGIPAYASPAAAVGAFLHMVKHRRGQELLAQTPPSLPPDVALRPEAAREVVARVLADGGEWLAEPDAKRVLRAFDIPAVETRVAPDPSAAGQAAEELGFPVAVKILSPDVLHKTDVGGVVLDLGSRADVEAAAAAMRARLDRLRPGARFEGFTVQTMARRPRAHELLVGAGVDPLFGPFVMFGQGGVAVEVIADQAVALPPLDPVLARELIARTRVWKLLQGYRDRPAADLEAICGALVRVSQMVIEVPEIIELDINPLIADETGVLALDARIRVRRYDAKPAERLAIRPYPSELEETIVLPSGKRILVRPIRPEDEPAHHDLLSRLDDDDIRFRFFNLIRRLDHSQMARYTQIDYDREMAFIATEAGHTQAVIRVVHDPAGARAEFAVVVRSDIKGQGLGRALLEKAIRYCRGRGTETLVGRVLSDNHRMLGLARSMGFEETPAGDGEVEVRLAV